jgi:Tfp pilus assembly protein PilO
MILGAAGTTENWPEAAIAIAGIALVTSVVVVALWQLLATWRARIAGSREAEYRRLAEQSAEAQARTAAALEQIVAELADARERRD